jgi:hypothetical protein
VSFAYPDSLAMPMLFLLLAVFYLMALPDYIIFSHFYQFYSAADWYITKYLSDLPSDIGIGIKKLTALEKKPSNTSQQVDISFFLHCTCICTCRLHRKLPTLNEKFAKCKLLVC